MNWGLIKPVFTPHFWKFTTRYMVVNYIKCFGAVNKLAQNDGAVVDTTVSFRYPENIYLGARVSIGENCCIWAHTGSKIRIGENSILGPHVCVFSSNHCTEAGIPIRDQGFEEAETVIGKDCWLGAGSVILKGVNLGDGTVVAAGAVVTRDTPPNSIIGGVPAKVISSRPGSEHEMQDYVLRAIR